jgi:hypothetical protein
MTQSPAAAHRRAVAASPAERAITSAAGVSAIAGTGSSPFTVITEGTPTPSIRLTGTLPRCMTLTDNHDGTADLAGTPDPSTGGIHCLSISAIFGKGRTTHVVTQLFMLTVYEAAAITSEGSATATTGCRFDFTVTTRGYSVAGTITESGALPDGVRFINSDVGTASLVGIPAPGSAGRYPLTIRASNGVGSPANQSFDLTVDD